VSGQLHAPAGISLGKGAPAPIGWESDWAPEQVWTQWRTGSITAKNLRVMSISV